MLDLKTVADRWQKEWENKKAFQVEVKDRKQKKYFLTTPYPYMNGYIHLGHLFTYIYPEVIARYKKMQGYNVLFKFGFHCTGTPIIAAANRIKEKEPKQTGILKQMGIAEKDIPKFADPQHWVDYFPKETLKDLKRMGFLIDERYTFRTTYLNPTYDAFIRWQFNKLKAKDHVKKGKHPVIWCPKDNVPVGDHDRAEGEGETPQEFLLFKHQLDDGRFVVSATLRQDTVLGITNLFVHPDIQYCEAVVDGEQWIIGEKAALALQDQGHSVKVTKHIKGKELIGKRTKEFDGSHVLILPATFVDPNVGTGLVHSVPSDSADDLIALWDLQKDEATLRKFHLNVDEVRSIKPIPVLNTPEYGDVAAEAMLKKNKVTSQQQRQLLDEIKKELYRISHYTATFNAKYKHAFSKNLEGKPVHEGKELIKKELIEKKFALPYYEPTGKVVCRCLTPCIVKVVENQWFLEYNDPTWKNEAHACLDQMKLYPEKVRKQFDYVLDWLDHWACTREYGLGTQLPWDKHWVIESLSDSTLQMAYCTIAPYLEQSKAYGYAIKTLDDAFFDFIFLGKGTAAAIEKSSGIPKHMLERMHEEFNYWYPFDFRNSAKDLVQNHLSFTLFNHTAIFPKPQWPKSYLVNGRVMVNNEKMSKSKGNFFTVRELGEKYGPDVIRLTAANAGEGIDDANFDMAFVEAAKKKLSDVIECAQTHYNKGRAQEKGIDRWLQVKINRSISEATKNLDVMLLKSAVKSAFLDMQRSLAWYTRRTKGDFHKETINRFIEVQLKLLTPFTPHVSEEAWHAIGKKNFVSLEPWPEAGFFDEGTEQAEELIEATLTDINQVLKLAKIEKPKKITLFVAEAWKHTAAETMQALLDQGERDFKKILTELLKNAELKQHAQDITKILPRVIKNGAAPHASSQRKELAAMQDAKTFIEREFSCTVEIIAADKSTEPKAKQSMPGKVAIVVA
ncbi:leucine--tRNA ligase [Candidatus Woesearchaeota archaeon]|nr:leucine--tRNA ligase [Candidatus Woesearchaeota archaeon]